MNTAHDASLDSRSGEYGDARATILALLPRLRRFALVLAGEACEADRLVEEVCSRGLCGYGVHQRLDQSIFRNMATFFMRKHEYDAMQKSEPDIDQPKGCTVGDNVGGDGINGQLTRAAILRLSAEQRVMIALVYIERFSYADSAEILQVTKPQFTRSLLDARLKLCAQQRPVSTA
jgi:RNA polymerase sigma-70 factor, ECF subfamily